MNFSRLHPVPLLVGLAVIVATVQLGNWQLRRATEKQAIGERLERYATGDPAQRQSARGEAPPEWSHVALSGEWLPEAVLYLDNRSHAHRPGYHVLMPLKLTDGSAVLINRGWVAAGSSREALPQLTTPAGTVHIEGRVEFPEDKPFSLTNEPREGLRWQYVDLAAYRDWSGLAVSSWIARQTSASPDGLIRDWPTPDLGEDMHRGYALQWYSLAALATALSTYYVFRSIRKNAA